MEKDRNYFVCSVCAPGEDYCEENYNRIIDEKKFVLYSSTLQKGTFYSIRENDIIILKYNNHFIAYGRVNNIDIGSGEGWNHCAYVDEWIFYDNENKKQGVSKYGIGWATIGGGQMGTVKTVTSKFAIDKIKAINSKSIIFQKIKMENKAKLDMEEIQEKINILKYKKQIILQGPPGTGKTREAKLIAKEMLVLDSLEDLKENTQFKIIQFHPSYTYEDFVRGIVAESKVDKVEYNNVNKTLGLFAKKAHENYLNSQKPTIEYSREKWVEEQFTNFKDKVAEIIEEDGQYNLTPNVSIVEVDIDGFRYIGNTWQAQNPHRMRFQDIKTAYLSNNQTRQELKNNPLVSGSAFQHATYYFKVLQDFRDNINEEMPNDFNITNRNELKNYIIIIDEINRANLSSVLGELIYALEYRGKPVESMYVVDDDNQLILPPNLYIIGTMNTADRSVGHIDYAIRRRFAFVDVLPENLKEKQAMDNFHDKLFLAVEKLFQEHTSPEFEMKDVQLGHSYFIDKSNDENGAGMDIRFEYEIKPILLEYVKDGVLIGKDIKKEIEELKKLI